MSKPLKGMFARSRPNININREFYSMATTDGDKAEIVMYGEIVNKQPVDWEGEPIEGMYIILDEFLEDLKAIEDVKKITIRINSVGGNAYASIAIHNRLREIKAEKTVIVDGVAMSGGSLIMCAGDKVKVNPSSLIMIHRCYVFMFGGYNSEELRKVANSNDAVDKAQAAIYKRKSGLEEENILSMMSDETYMTGSEAVEKGFADELAEGEVLDIAASADLSTLYVNGRALRLSTPLSKLPESIPTFKSEKKDEINNMPAIAGDEGGNEPMAKTIEELRTKYPELTKQLEDEVKAAAPNVDASVEDAVAAERKRQSDIDEIAVAINDDELVHEAKYGEKPCTAQELAFRAMQKRAKQGEQYISDTKEDYKNSNAGEVGVVPGGGEIDPSAKVDQTVDAGVKAAKEAFGGK